MSDKELFPGEENVQRTPGEWRADGCHLMAGGIRIAFFDNDMSAAFLDGKEHPIGPREARANCRQAAAAINEREALRAEVEALRGQVAALREALKRHGHGQDEVDGCDDCDALNYTAAAAAAHDERVRREAFQLALDHATDALMEVRENERKAISKGSAPYELMFRYVANVTEMYARIERLMKPLATRPGGET